MQDYKNESWKNSYLLLIKLKKIIALKQSNKKKHNTQQDNNQD